MNFPIECIDHEGRRVIVTEAVATHVSQRHVEMMIHLEKICDVLKTPDLVYFRKRTDSYIFYKLGVLSGSMSRNYMVVIAKYDENGEGLVRTTFSTGKPANGDMLVHMAGGA